MTLQYSLDPDNSSMDADQVTHYLTSLPYLQRREELLLPPNNYPRFFYKYLGPRVEEERLRNLFIDSRLHLQSPANFNDPFDMKGNIVNELDRRKREEGLNKLFKKMAPPLERSERRTKVRKAARDPKTFPELKQSLEVCHQRM